MKPPLLHSGIMSTPKLIQQTTLLEVYLLTLYIAGYMAQYFSIARVNHGHKRPAGMTDDIPENDSKVKVETVTYTTRTSVRDPVAEMMERFSSWCCLKKVLSWILRYKSNLQAAGQELDSQNFTQTKSSNIINPISITELNNTEDVILNYIQNQSFKQEFAQLTGSNRQPRTLSDHKYLSKSSSIYKLDPVFIQGLLRVGGRLKRASLNTDVKHPIILPKDHHVAKFIIRYYHHVSAH